MHCALCTVYCAAQIDGGEDTARVYIPSASITQLAITRRGGAWGSARRGCSTPAIDSASAMGVCVCIVCMYVQRCMNIWMYGGMEV